MRGRAERDVHMGRVTPGRDMIRKAIVQGLPDDV